MKTILNRRGAIMAGLLYCVRQISGQETPSSHVPAAQLKTVLTIDVQGEQAMDAFRIRYRGREVVVSMDEVMDVLGAGDK